MKKLVWLSGIVLSFCSPPRKMASTPFSPFQYAETKTVTATHGVVVCAHPIASKVGVAIMKSGGNAFDAAIATQLALAVVYPGAGNLGGGGFMVARTADGKTLALDYREMAPGKATRDMYLDAQGNVEPGKSLNGHLASGVPGTVAGLFETLRYGRLPFSKLIQPAIDLAEKGFAITASEARSLNNIQEDLARYNTAANAFERRQPWREGDTLIQPELAATLRRLQRFGRADFYEGATAHMIVDEMSKGGGLIALSDLKSYEAKWRTPETFDYKGYTIVSMPMPSSGGILLHQMMKMVEDRPLPSYGFLSAQSVQLMVEVERRAYADRAEYMGDADFYHVPRNGLTSASYLKERMQSFTPGRAGSSEQMRPGKLLMKESEQTTHLSIIDEQGNCVAVTTTLNNSYGSKTVVAHAGFFMNDEMDDFSSKPGTPNLFGAVGGEANAIAPGKRMLSSMTPTLVLQGDKPFLVAGTPGGTTITTSVFQTLIDIIDFHLSTQDAVDKPKFHHQWLPDQIDVEKTFPMPLREELKAMGYKIVERPAIGRTDVIRVLPSGQYEGVADHRGNDDAEGY